MRIVSSLIPFWAYLILLSGIFLTGNYLHQFVYSAEFKLGNAILFILSFISFIGMGLCSFKNKVPSLKSIAWFSVVLILASFFIFFFTKDVLNGRLMLYPLFVSDYFGDEWTLMVYAKFLDQRTLQKVLFDIIQYVFNLSFNLDVLVLINRFFSLGILLTIYRISRILTKSYSVSILCLLTFVSSNFTQQLLTSIEYGTPALFFLLLSVYFYLDKKLPLSIICLFVATYFRYEIAVLAGVPYLFTIVLSKRDNMVIWLVAIGLLYRAAPIATHVVEGKDFYLHGNKLSPGFFAVLGNIPYVFQQNIFQHSDWSLTSGSITLFTYTNLIIFLGLAFRFNKEPLEYFWISLIGVFYMTVTLFFHIEGLRSGQKYSVNYFAFEVLITYVMILRILSKTPVIAKFVCWGFFILAFSTSPVMNFDMTKTRLIEVEEYNALKATHLNNKCFVIKFQNHHPLMSYYFPHRFTTVDWKEVTTEGIEKGECYYYFNQHFRGLRPEVDRMFNSCNKKSIFEKEYFGLMQYSC